MSYQNFNNDFRYYNTHLKNPSNYGNTYNTSKIENSKSQSSRQEYLKNMQSSQETQYQQEQSRLQKVKQAKQELADFRKATTFGDEQDRANNQKSYKDTISMQVHINNQRNQQIQQNEQQLNQKPFEFWTKVSQNNETDHKYRQQMLKQIQQENNQLAEEKKLQQKYEKFVDSKTNSDQFIDYDKRNRYYF